jgi:hypothetical protein
MIKEYREEKAAQGRPRFLSMYSYPVLLMPNMTASLRPPGVNGSGFMTRAPDGATAPGGAPAKKMPLVVNETFLVIPIRKEDGHPFPERIGVGRTKGTDIMLPDRDVSKYHGYFSSTGDKWSFTDVGSSNGTLIRGERLSPMVATSIEDGVEICFGNGRYVFRTAAGFCDQVCG